jgi:hypothetical protein
MIIVSYVYFFKKKDEDEPRGRKLEPINCQKI